MLLFFYVYYIYVWETQIDKNHEHNFVFMFIITQHELCNDHCEVINKTYWPIKSSHRNECFHFFVGSFMDRYLQM